MQEKMIDKQGSKRYVERRCLQPNAVDERFSAVPEELTARARQIAP